MKTNFHNKSIYAKAIQYINQHYFVGPADLEEAGFYRQYIRMLEKDGYVEKYHRGAYISKNFTKAPEFASFLYTCKQIPKGTICLLSALEYYNLTTQIPGSMWIATDYNYVEAKNFPITLAIVRLPKQCLEAGLIKKNVLGNELRIFSPAKTVADCFKFRNKIGINIAIEALEDCLKKKMATVNEIYQYAKINRVHNVIKPYIETLINT